MFLRRSGYIIAKHVECVQTIRVSCPKAYIGARHRLSQSSNYLSLHVRQSLTWPRRGIYITSVDNEETLKHLHSVHSCWRRVINLQFLIVTTLKFMKRNKVDRARRANHTV